MHSDMNKLRDLANRLRQRDAGAALEFWKELEGSLIRMVRRVMRTREGTTTLARRILAEAEQVERGQEMDDDGLIEQVAQRICQEMIRRLQEDNVGAPWKDTVLS